MKSVFGVSIGFTGTRWGMTEYQKKRLKTILNKIKIQYSVFTFHHGDCIGADEQAHTIAVEAGGLIVIHPPTDFSKRAFCEGDKLKEKNYLDRNRDIVDSCDLLIAAPKQIELNAIRGGTWYTIKYARKKNVKHIIIEPDKGDKCRK